MNGTLYDVEFRDGLLSNSISAFTSADGALASSVALRDQVFIGNFDTSADLTLGCSGAGSTCLVYTPFSTSLGNVDATRFVNRSGNFGDPVSVQATYSDVSTTSLSYATIAYWTASAPVASVPEPEVYTMMFAGVGLFGFVAGRRKQKTAV